MSWLDCVLPSHGLTGEMGLRNSTFYWNQLPNSRKMLSHVEAHVHVCTVCVCVTVLVQLCLFYFLFQASRFHDNT